MNKMPKATTKKTESARSKRSVLILVLVLGLLVFGFQQSAAKCPPQKAVYRNDKNLSINGRNFAIEVAHTDNSRQKGLGGRDCIPKNQAMLFVFDKSSPYCFWMKGMRFPIDIVWLNTEKRIVHQENSVQPVSYPNRYCPPVEAQYVLEFHAGTTRAVNLTTGQQLSF